MDDLKRAFFEVCLERDFLKKKGNEFQDFFCELMEKRYPGDFIRTRPWGQQGDAKNDGYLKSKRTLFQVYAPNELSADNAIAKIKKDFAEALPHWKDHFNCWRFVHNSRQGLGPEVLKVVLDLGKTNSGIEIKNFDFEEFRNEVFKLSDNDIASLLGPAPTSKDIMGLGFSKLEPLLLTVARKEPALDSQIRPVPKHKLEVNQLSNNVEVLLRAGMRKSDLVGSFFAKWHDPTLGDQVAEAFSSKYLELKGQGLPPDQIFFELHTFTGGGHRGNPDHEASVLAVLAYLFEECDIFERPNEVSGIEPYDSAN